MKVHCIRHEPFEGIAAIEEWIAQKNYQVSYTYTYLNQALPAAEDLDMLIIMGGIKSVYGSLNEDWLIDELYFVERCLKLGKQVLGICLGSQILAHVLGGKVYKANEIEAGWFPVYFNKDARNVLTFLPDKITSFHLHNDTYELPASVQSICYSDLTANQGFTYGENAVGLQFHPEVTCESLWKLVRGSGWKFEANGRYIQSETEIMAHTTEFESNIRFTHQLLDHLQGTQIIAARQRIA